MRTPATHDRDIPQFDDSYFERRALDLVVADDEIEAWELDAQDLEGLADSALDLDRLG